MIEKLEAIVAQQVEAIQNLKIDKITVWDSAGGGNGEGKSSTANFVSSLIGSLPPIHDVARMAGVELPDYLGKVVENGHVEEDGKTAVTARVSTGAPKGTDDGDPAGPTG